MEKKHLAIERAIRDLSMTHKMDNDAEIDETVVRVISKLENALTKNKKEEKTDMAICTIRNTRTGAVRKIRMKLDESKLKTTRILTREEAISQALRQVRGRDPHGMSGNPMAHAVIEDME